MWWVLSLSLSAPRTWNKPSVSVSSFCFGLPLKRDLLSTLAPLSLSPPHCSFLFPSFTFSRSLDFSWLYSDSLHSLRVKEQKDWLVCLLWRRKKGEQGKEKGKMVKMENSWWDASDKLCTLRDKNDSSNVNTWKWNICRWLTKFYESFIFNGCIRIHKDSDETSLSFAWSMQNEGHLITLLKTINFSTNVLDPFCKGFL